MKPTQKPSSDYSVRYDKAEITYISQFLVSAGNEEVLLDLSSGLIDDSHSQSGENLAGKPTLPIQARVALSWSAAQRLANVLNKVIATRQQTTKPQSGLATTQQTAAVVPQATLPQMSSSTTR
jgi:hypothetical protein